MAAEEDIAVESCWRTRSLLALCTRSESTNHLADGYLSPALPSAVLSRKERQHLDRRRPPMDFVAFFIRRRMLPSAPDSLKRAMRRQALIGRKRERTSSAGVPPVLFCRRRLPKRQGSPERRNNDSALQRGHYRQPGQLSRFSSTSNFCGNLSDTCVEKSDNNAVLVCHFVAQGDL